MDSDKTRTDATTPSTANKARPQWLIWALASGGFAAFNGVFAKLTTTSSTTALAHHISTSPLLDYALRALFFALNLLSNAIMWFLFTRALTAATSTVCVSILNTSANFIVTAILGMLIFGEHLPLGWWAGAGLLVAGSVVIGRREGAESAAGVGDAGADAEGTVGGGAIALPLDGEDRVAKKKDVSVKASDGEQEQRSRKSSDLARKGADSDDVATRKPTDDGQSQPFTDEVEEDDQGRRNAWNS